VRTFPSSSGTLRCSAPSGGGVLHQRFHLLSLRGPRCRSSRQHRLQDVPSPRHIEHDDGEVVVHAQGDGVASMTLMFFRRTSR